ncbi:hypothetical protein GCM10022205_38700 [Spinactinospora alkalitolerans]
MPGEISSQDHIRAADADRDAVAERLATALAEGRLDLEEYDLRLSSAMRAATLGQLEPLTADLPLRQEARSPEPPASDAGSGDASPWREWFDEWRSWLGGAVIMVAIWGGTSLLNGEPQAFWPVLPLGIWAAILIAGLFWPQHDGCGGKSG